MTLPPRAYPAALLAACLLALVSALTAQFVFHLLPCILCLYQRVPFVLSAVFCAVALLPRLSSKGRMILLLLCAVVLTVNSGIAVYHVGVEDHWWAGTAKCIGGEPIPMNAADMLASLDAPPPARCDQPAWRLFGISMAGYNIPFSLVLALFAAWASRRVKESA